VLGVAGGDGTVSRRGGRRRGPVAHGGPAGTRNHFARDLGLDVRDPAQTLGALVDGEGGPGGARPAR